MQCEAKDEKKFLLFTWYKQCQAQATTKVLLPDGWWCHVCQHHKENWEKARKEEE